MMANSIVKGASEVFRSSNLLRLNYKVIAATINNAFTVCNYGTIINHRNQNCAARNDRYSNGLPFSRRFYSPQVKEHFNNPRNVGSFDKNDPNVGTAIVGKAACGDVIKLQIKVKDNKIEDACFKTFGCGSAIASSSYATEIIKGMSTEQALKIKNTDISEELNLPPVKIHCSLLAEDAVKHAIKDYLSKQEKHSD